MTPLKSRYVVFLSLTLLGFDLFLSQMTKERWNGIPSQHRDMSPDEALAKFAEMATGSEEGMRWCIRAKISFDDPNKAMRDPVIYRGNELPHHRTGLVVSALSFWWGSPTDFFGNPES